MLLPIVDDGGAGYGKFGSPSPTGARTRGLWSDVEVRRLESLFLYVLTRATDGRGHHDVAESGKASRHGSRHGQYRRKRKKHQRRA